MQRLEPNKSHKMQSKCYACRGRFLLFRPCFLLNSHSATGPARPKSTFIYGDPGNRKAKAKGFFLSWTYLSAPEVLSPNLAHSTEFLKEGILQSSGTVNHSYNSPLEKSQFLASTFWAGLHPLNMQKHASMLQESSLSQLLVGAGDFTLSNESKPESHAAVNSWEASCRAHRCDGSSGMEDCTGLASMEPRVLAEFRWDNPKAATLSPQHVLLLCSCLPYPSLLSHKSDMRSLRSS